MGKHVQVVPAIRDYGRISRVYIIVKDGRVPNLVGRHDHMRICVVFVCGIRAHLEVRKTLLDRQREGISFWGNDALITTRLDGTDFYTVVVGL